MRKKTTMTKKEAQEYMAERQTRRLPGYKRIMTQRALDEFVAAREALKKHTEKKKPRKSIIAIAEEVNNHAVHYGVYAVSLAEEILRLDRIKK